MVQDVSHADPGSDRRHAMIPHGWSPTLWWNYQIQGLICGIWETLWLGGDRIGLQNAAKSADELKWNWTINRWKGYWWSRMFPCITYILIASFNVRVKNRHKIAYPCIEIYRLFVEKGFNSTQICELVSVKVINILIAKFLYIPYMLTRYRLCFILFIFQLTLDLYVQIYGMTSSILFSVYSPGLGALVWSPNAAKWLLRVWVTSMNTS